ncbi:PAS domain S-box protein [Thermosulfurimonas marina]|uniref:histidine kinase n=1 Tax=Thermosulfurimonas marina TaxID=2047767 RepID=A0A6H1WTI9_9BACT|nr:PAS domain-containing sensor histidine kinase [Thermosulfurimonas marina]QJA06436.1 PAS domain S-box protein [Thermosulfurimonas marina]
MKSEAFYQTILDLFPGLVSVVSRDYRVLYANRKLRERCGRDPVGDLCYRVFHDREDPCPWCKKDEVLREGKSVLQEIHSPKDRRWFEVRSLPFPLEDERAYLSIILDITEKKLLEEKIEKERAFLHKILEENPVLVLFNREGKISFINRTFEEITGFSREEALGKSVFELLAPEEALSDWKKHCEKVQCGIFERGVELPVRDRRGRLHYLLWNCMRVEDPEGIPVIIGMAVDITEQKRLQEEHFQIQKMESLGRFTGVLLHELNNLFMALQGYISVSLLKLDRPENIRENLERMEELIHRWRRMSQELLFFVRKRTSQAEILDLARALHRLRETLERLLGSKIRLHLEAPEGNLLVRLSPVALQQILLNLASNAREAMEGEGEIWIRLEKVELPEESARVLDLKPGPYALLTFRDRGPGLSPEALSHLFEPYFTTKKEGTGLGLATIYSLVKQHGGHIAAYNHPEGGAVFRLYLPLADSPRAEGPSEGLSLLVVEENQILLETLKDLLEYLGYRPRLARGFAEAERILEEGFVPQILLTDIRMRSGPKEEEIRKLASRFPEMKVIIASPYPRETIEKSLPELRGRLIPLAKPFSLEDLRQAVERAGGAP